MYCFYLWHAPKLPNHNETYISYANICGCVVTNFVISSQFESEAVAPDLYLMEWFVTLFCKRLALDVVSRVWDCYLLLGEPILYRVAVVCQYVLCCLMMLFSPICFIRSPVNRYEAHFVFRSILGILWCCETHTYTNRVC